MNKYEKPVLRKVQGLDALKLITTRFVRACRQCSSCHGCR